MIQQGSLSSDQLDQLAMCRILFLCTGNTCRSPMAEALCKKLLADHLACTPADLPRHGYVVQSAGLSAFPGNEASADAVRAVAEYGGDLSVHRSQGITMDLLVQADHIFAMTAGHAIALAPLREVANPRLLSPTGVDVADPIGREFADYRDCASQIIQYLRARLPELLESN
jgi:protein-tyrosine phosphatase